MTDDVELHYDALLGDHYDWMLGDIDEAARAQAGLLRPFAGVQGASGGLGLDLGCGTGLHTLVLASLGFESVVCVDVSATMLAALEANTRGRVEVTAIHADLADAWSASIRSRTFSAVVCMGDTLTHLPGTDAVGQLFRDVRDVLGDDGWFAISWRDLTVPLHGVDRFLPVRSDDDTILTCFLEDAGSHVRVHDVIHQRSETGVWDQSVSSYDKLKLAPADVASLLADAGFTDPLVERGPRGLWVVVARP
jgi:SAM-dependent methyltransferase